VTAGPGAHRPLEFHCADVGVACRNVARAESEDELLTAVAEHARRAHGVELNETLVDFARTRVRNGDEGAHA
jgi:predicted small metal-binding protein